MTGLIQSFTYYIVLFHATTTRAPVCCSHRKVGWLKKLTIIQALTPGLWKLVMMSVTIVIARCCAKCYIHNPILIIIRILQARKLSHVWLSAFAQAHTEQKWGDFESSGLSLAPSIAPSGFTVASVTKLPQERTPSQYPWADNSERLWVEAWCWFPHCSSSQEAEVGLVKLSTLFSQWWSMGMNASSGGLQLSLGLV